MPDVDMFEKLIDVGHEGGGLDQIVVARVVSLDVPVGQTMIECQLTLLSIAIFRLARWSLSAAGAAVLGN